MNCPSCRKVVARGENACACGQEVYWCYECGHMQLLGMDECPGCKRKIVWLDPPCCCDFYPDGRWHYHSRLWKKLSLGRFRVAGPPLTREEYEKFLQDAA